MRAEGNVWSIKGPCLQVQLQLVDLGFHLMQLCCDLSCPIEYANYEHGKQTQQFGLSVKSLPGKKL